MATAGLRWGRRNTRFAVRRQSCIRDSRRGPAFCRTTLDLQAARQIGGGTRVGQWNGLLPLKGIRQGLMGSDTIKMGKQLHPKTTMTLGLRFEHRPRGHTGHGVSRDRVDLTGFRPLGLPHHRTCGFPHTAVESGGLRCCTRKHAGSSTRGQVLQSSIRCVHTKNASGSSDAVALD